MGAARRQFWRALVATAPLALILGWIDLGLHPGILPYELAFTAERAAAILEGWGPAGHRLATASLVVDMAFLVAYAALFSSALRWAGGAEPVARLPWIAAGCDALENTALLVMIARGPSALAAGAAGVLASVEVRLAGGVPRRARLAGRVPWTTLPGRGRRRMRDLLILGLAGGLGTVCRYGVGVWAADHLGTRFPWGTLAVNVVGCLLMGAMMHGILATDALPRWARLALTTGFLGGLTTFSTFGFESVVLIERGQLRLAAAYLAGNVVVGLLAAWAGMGLARAALGPVPG